MTPWLRGDDSPLLSVPISDPSFLQSQDERMFLSVESSGYSWVFHFFFFLALFSLLHEGVTLVQVKSRP